MAFRPKRARPWCLVTAAACVLVCAAVVPAAAEDRTSGLPQQPAAVSELAVAQSAAFDTVGLDTVKRVYTRVFTGEGFDTCHAPSLKTMAAWWKSSPYRAIGIYIGGPNRACGDGNLSNSWVHAVSAMGWHLVPIYVGQQAPCEHQPHLGLMNAKNAADDAASAAENAANRAAALGIARGSAIYFDLESYGRKNAGCTNTVVRYIGAWTGRLHAEGYLAGVYSSAGSGITDLAHVSLPGLPRPDALWIARWDNKSTVQDPSVPSNAWMPHQRIKQFTGGHKESHGGVTIDIDRDWLDGPVARIG
jgi:Domain of unknown function (DUF1906)